MYDLSCFFVYFIISMQIFVYQYLGLKYIYIYIYHFFNYLTHCLNCLPQLLNLLPPFSISCLIWCLANVFSILITCSVCYFLCSNYFVYLSIRMYASSCFCIFLYLNVEIFIWLLRSTIYIAPFSIICIPFSTVRLK